MQSKAVQPVENASPGLGSSGGKSNVAKSPKNDRKIPGARRSMHPDVLASAKTHKSMSPKAGQRRGSQTFKNSVQKKRTIIGFGVFFVVLFIGSLIALTTSPEAVTPPSEVDARALFTTAQFTGGKIENPEFFELICNIYEFNRNDDKMLLLCFDNDSLGFACKNNKVMDRVCDAESPIASINGGCVCKGFNVVEPTDECIFNDEENCASVGGFQSFEFEVQMSFLTTFFSECQNAKDLENKDQVNSQMRIDDTQVVRCVNDGFTEVLQCDDQEFVGDFCANNDIGDIRAATGPRAPFSDD